MEQKIKKKHHYFLSVFVIILIFAAESFYAYKFPATMELLDKEVNEVFSLTEKEEKCTFFSEFSSFAGKIINGTEYWIEVIKDNIEGKFENTKKISAFIISSAAKFPLENKNITSEFGKRTNPVSGKAEIHSGIDIAAAEGSNVFPAWPGKIIKTGYDEIYGNYVLIEHADGFFSKYCHLSGILMKENDFVNIATAIGKAGNTGWSTGSHLHFEVEIDGIKIDPLECFAI